MDLVVDLLFVCGLSCDGWMDCLLSFGFGLFAAQFVFWVLAGFTVDLLIR